MARECPQQRVITPTQLCELRLLDWSLVDDAAKNHTRKNAQIRIKRQKHKNVTKILK